MVQGFGELLRMGGGGSVDSAYLKDLSRVTCAGVTKLYTMIEDSGMISISFQHFLTLLTTALLPKIADFNKNR